MENAQEGPGAAATLSDRVRAYPTLTVAAVAALIGWMPPQWMWWFIGGYLGPIPIPAIFAMVGMLFAVLSLFHAADQKDRFLRNGSAIVIAVVFVRLFVMPFFGWPQA